MKIIIKIILIFMLQSALAFGQYQQKNEDILFSFQTSNGKQLSICMDKNGDYIVYRFGTKNKIELEFPEVKDRSSFQKFVYSYWLRGGGIKNEEIDLNYLAFTIEKTKYIVYDTYFANGERYNVGIKVINLNSEHVVDIPGIFKTREGNLVDFRTKALVTEGDELYD